MSDKTKTINAETFNELVDALDVLMRKWHRKDEAYVRMVAHQGNVKAQAKVREWDEEDGALDVPDTFHDGSPITSVKDLSAVMGISEWSAAVYVQEKGVRHPLYAEAKAVVDSEFSGTAALMLIPRNAGKFTVDGGVKPEDLHCTLLYVGDIKSMAIKTRDEFIDFAKSLQLPIIDASVNGQTVFYNEPEKPIFVLNVDSPQLEAARRKVMEGIDVPQTHGYTPHMTVKYLGKGEAPPTAAKVPVQAIFDVLRVAYDGVDTDIPLVPAQTMDQIDVETKGVIRRVRTPAGVRKYGQPIGSIIVADSIALPDKWDAFRDKDGLVWGTSVRDAEIVHETDTYSAHARELGTGVMVYIRDKVRGRQHSHYLDRNEWSSLSAAERKKRATRMAEFSMPKFVQAGDPYYKYEGIRGFDWTYEGDDPPSRNKEDEDERWSWALSDSEELGIEWESDGNEAWFDELDVRSVEAVNNIMRQHEEWFPGFTEKVISKFRTVPADPHSPRAYASASMPNGKAGGGSKSQINLYRHFWAAHADATVESKRYGVLTNQWSSSSIDKIATEHDMDTFSAAAHATVVHEIGHAIVNQVGMAGNGWLDLDPTFTSGLMSILKEHGALNEKGQPIASVIGKEVSQYGATQPHELLAEAWSSYILSSQPTALVEDIGRYMEALLTKFLEETN